LPHVKSTRLLPHVESTRCCQPSSPCGPVFSWIPTVGGARSATRDAAGTEAVAHRDERVARRGRTTACDRTGSAQHRGIPFEFRQPAHRQPRPLAPRGRTPARAHYAGTAMVAILVALRRRGKGVAKSGGPWLALGLSRLRSACAGRLACTLTAPLRHAAAEPRQAN
jgi:hypothetical protein